MRVGIAALSVGARLKERRGGGEEEGRKIGLAPFPPLFWEFAFWSRVEGRG